MKEQEYIEVTDRVKVSNALNTLRNVLPSIFFSSVIKKDEYTTAMKILIKWEKELFDNIMEEK